MTTHICASSPRKDAEWARNVRAVPCRQGVLQSSSSNLFQGKRHAGGRTWRERGREREREKHNMKAATIMIIFASPPPAPPRGPKKRILRLQGECANCGGVVFPAHRDSAPALLGVLEGPWSAEPSNRSSSTPYRLTPPQTEQANNVRSDVRW
jgi:hypothetical protein